MRLPLGGARRRPGRLAPGAVALAIAVLMFIAACGGPPTSAPDAPTPGMGAPAAEREPDPVPPPPGSVVDPNAIPAPTAVRIPSIELEQGNLQQLGLDVNGEAEIPQDFGRIGYFDNRATIPGRTPTVLLGHIDSVDGPAIFFRIPELEPGDTVEVDRVDGTTGTYAVERVDQVPKNEFPTFAVFGATNDDIVRLVTCGGDFDREARSYLDNVVVHAKRV